MPGQLPLVLRRCGKAELITGVKAHFYLTISSYQQEKMDQSVSNEEKMREAACTGDLIQLKKLIETESVNVNSQNKMNGW